MGKKNLRREEVATRTMFEAEKKRSCHVLVPERELMRKRVEPHT